MKSLVLSALFLATVPSGLAAHEIKSDIKPGTESAFDVTRAAAVTDGATATFLMEVAGKAGSIIPKAVGVLQGSKVNAYVWPTSLDPQTVGFTPKSGILALTVTAHPDFDDTPLQDENGDGDKANDGKSWHSHWVVLEKDTACGGGLKVRDITPGTDLMPKTAPGLPLALDSPGATPLLDDSAVSLAVPLTTAEGAAFDGVTAELQVNADGKVPLLCVTSVMDVASGDLSLPGKITKAK
jgi:hypothetical protein